ncbi:short transient receptor potential channel 7-like [Tubulanus polymorphus]|uniref:short transient receptor potential channel 7-like n=1 Tax=Tubulanus polymorphus TaxID=672921 RepID=UPI003DA4354B
MSLLRENSSEQRHVSDMIEILTPRCEPLDFYEALMSAIRQGKAAIACFLVKSPEYDVSMAEVRVLVAAGANILRRKHEKRQHRGKNKSKSAAQDDILDTRKDAYSITLATNASPIVLAAQMNLFEVVKTLLDKGEKIEPPSSNLVLSELDPYYVAKHRLETFRGVCSEAYVSLANDDPIRTAMDLGRSLRKAASQERHFSEEYNQLADALSSYLVKLMDHVRNTRELDTIINHNRDGTEDKFATLKLAVDYGEMKFISHPACQQELEMTWYGPMLTTSNSTFKMALFWLFFCPAYPVLSLLYLALPHTKIEKLMRIPFVKFVGHVFMFLVLMVLLTLVTSTLTSTIPSPQNDHYFGHLNRFFTNYSNKYKFDIGDRLVIRGIQFSSIQIMVIIWVAGLLWQEMKQVYVSGFKLHFSEVQNYLDFILLSMYIAAFTVYAVVFAKLHFAVEYFRTDSAWMLLVNGNQYAKHQYYYIVGGMYSADRMVWQPNDPFVVYECIFSIANFMTFGRISAFLPASNVLGPLQIGIYKIMKDVLKFLFILGVMLTPFWVALVNTYWYYNIRTLQNSTMFVEYEQAVTQVKASAHFTTMSDCLLTLFWSMFGYADGAFATIHPFNQPVTQGAGLVLFAGYHIMVVIVCVNLLIALMTRTFDAVSEHEDVEWKYARTRLFLEYIDEGRTLAAPFNLIPSVKSIYKIVKAPFTMRVTKKESNNEDLKMVRLFPISGKSFCD